ncbi:cytochrome c [Ideonella sp. DXS29W]|uniref:Cytochrome c n=2 Tax=Ideonella lacteola TaxID=2984193 RepID=A0ABU9BXT6_9BURK
MGRRLFTAEATPACAVCHTLNDAGATGEIGPSLDLLRPDAPRIDKALRNGVGVMPAFRERLSEAQIQALVRYVSTVAGRTP